MAHELLNGLSSAEAEQILELGTRQIVPSGTLLFRLGDTADRLFLLDNAIVVAFDDGKTALYSAALLYATLSQARLLEPSFSESDQIHLIAP